MSRPILSGLPSSSPPLPPHETEGSTHLDALRGAAALVVFCNHTRALYFASPIALQPYQGAVNAQPGNASRLRALDGEITFATEAVVIFFVLSGYLVGGSVIKSLARGKWSWRLYLTKRLTRLYVVLLPAIILGVALDHLGLHLAGPGSVYFNPRGIPLAVTYMLVERLRWPVVLGNLAFMQGVLVSEVGTNTATWSLANEFWYYVTFPMVAICFFDRYKLWIRAVYSLMAAGLLYFITLPLAAQFPIWILGALLVILPQRLSEGTARLGTAMSFVILLSTMILVRLLHFRAINADYLIAIATFVFLHCATQLRRPAASTLYKRVSGFFSRISYSLYLFHLPLAVFLCGRLNKPWHPWNASASHLLAFAGIDLFSLLVVWGLWRIFEANTDWVRRQVFERSA